MWEFLIISFLRTLGSSGLQFAGSDSCNISGFRCIPLSECEIIKNDLQLYESSDIAKSAFCGYFHEPYVCCDKNCYTPNGNYGRSVYLDACTHLKANEQSSDLLKRKFLFESYVNKTHVCCNEGENSYRRIAPAPIDTLTSLSSSCTTPNGDTAKCKHVHECDAFKEVAMEIDERFRFINDSFCGLWKEPMVCCGEDSKYKKNYENNLPDAADCGLWYETINPTIPPWLALITSVWKTCVGAVINQEYVLATVQCAGENYEGLDVKIGECINDEARDDCRFRISEFKIFPLHRYLLTEDTGMVLLKLSRTIRREDFMPVCLPIYDVIEEEKIHLIGLERSVSNWKGTKITTKAVSNDGCRNALKIYLEKIVCIEESSLCRNTKKPFLQNFVLRTDNGRWQLEGLFNTDGCYGPHKNYFNAIYVYKFLPWIYSNVN